MTEIIEPPVLDDADTAPVDDFANRQNSGRCIVAIPAATEPIHHLGDVGEPKHMTMVWLGKPEENPDLDMNAVQDAVAEVAEQTGAPLTGQVSGTGSLGADGARVVFLHGDEVHQAHDDLLNHPVIAPAYGAVEQHPGFTPHTTLGYGQPDPDANYDTGDLDQVVFDRLGVWDGDEHTEYPLGPSASTEENTEPVDVISGEDMGLAPEFLDALTEAMTKPIVISGPEDMVAAIKQCSGACGTAQMATRPILIKRARELGFQHLIPQTWLRQAAQIRKAAVAAQSAPTGQDAPNLFQLKTQQSTLPDTVLRAAYMRGVREYAMTAPQSRPPLSRDVIAQARVNSLIRLAQGDLSARTDDQDLLP